jgi:putative ATPase
MYQRGTVLFIDEIHRLNKAQQDVFLPYVESGDIVLIGATTENPSFEVNSALLSRSRVVVFKRHLDESLLQILKSAFKEYELTIENIFEEDALTYMLQLADGDARRLLNRIEEIVIYYQNTSDKSTFPVNVERLKELLGSKTLYHDKSGESHYDTISAFIKSLRGSDPDAGLYYLARLLEGGEDPKFIARRLVILASEDIGNADPRALTIATSGFQAVEMIGLPECAINLAQVVVYLASAPKSNSSYMGLKSAQAEVQKSGQLPIPLSVRNAPTRLMKEIGYGKNYNYAHSGDKGWLSQQFLPDDIKEKRFYESRGLGFEKKMNEYIEWLKR